MLKVNSAFLPPGGGYGLPGYEPEKYAWAVKRMVALVEELNANAMADRPTYEVRIALPTEYGRAMGAAIVPTTIDDFAEDGERFAEISLIRFWYPGTGLIEAWDINDHKPAFETFLTAAREILT